MATWTSRRWTVYGYPRSNISNVCASIGTDNFTDIESLAALLTVNPSGVSFTATATNESTPDAEDGTITFAGLMGATNYETTIDGGMNWSMDLSYKVRLINCSGQRLVKTITRVLIWREAVTVTTSSRSVLSQETGQRLSIRTTHLKMTIRWWDITITV